MIKEKKYLSQSRSDVHRWTNATKARDSREWQILPCRLVVSIHANSTLLEDTHLSIDHVSSGIGIQVDRGITVLSSLREQLLLIINYL